MGPTVVDSITAKMRAEGGWVGSAGFTGATGGNRTRDGGSALDGHGRQGIGSDSEEAVLEEGISVLGSGSSTGVRTIGSGDSVRDRRSGSRRMSSFPGPGEERRKREMNVQLVITCLAPLTYIII